MQGAFNQAVAYARTFKNRPPFLITCDIGESFQIWSDFGAASELDYGSYDARQEIPFADLVKPEIRELFFDIFTDPQKQNPEKIAAQVTREVAADLAELAKSLEAAGHEPKLVADFLMRCIFTMFAEDVGLLSAKNGEIVRKDPIFTENLEQRWQPHPHKFQAGIEALWAAMNEGKPFWDYGELLQFNGGLFEDNSAIPLNGEQLAVLLRAAKRDWRQVEPAIFGTLLERALDQKERSKLGAHYTPRAYVERLVRPVVLEPLRERWRLVQIEVDQTLSEMRAEVTGSFMLWGSIKTTIGDPEDNNSLDKTQFSSSQNTIQPEQQQITNSSPRKAQRDRAILKLENFLKELQKIKILDPACGTGNFLYVTMNLMKELESEVLARLAEVSGRDQLRLDFGQINPSQFLGIEINPRAVAIANLVVWIGYLQWHFRRFGDLPPNQPVLRAFNKIENRDAVLAYDGVEPDIDPKTGQVRTRWGGRTMIHPVTGKAVPDPSDQKVIYRYLNPRPAEWPAADYIVSNPPFLGNRDMRDTFGDGYVEALSQTYAALPDTLDYVMYWWHRSAQCIEKHNLYSFGLITTNTIRQSRQRKVIDLHLNNKHGIKLFFAIPDHPWSSEGAAVRISMSAGCSKMEANRTCTISNVINEGIGSSPESEAESIEIQSTKVLEISDDLSQYIGVSSATLLESNSRICCPGIKPYGSGFTIEQDSINFFPENEITIIKPYMNGSDLTRKSREVYIIDCDEINEKSLQTDYPTIYQWLLERVYPKRVVERDEKIKIKWWGFERPRLELRRAIQELQTYIATVQTSKHRVFIFLGSEVIPDQQIVVIALEDAYFLGVLSSKIHVTWALAAGGRLGVGNDPRYNKTVCFDPFPFPDPDDRLKQEIRELGDRLDAHRKTVQANHPDITITGMYNLLEKIRAGQPLTDKDREFNQRALVSTLKQIHDDLDRAVFRAYGWDDLIPQWERAHSGAPLPEQPTNSLDEQILERLVKLNAERAEEERNGHIRWLRPDYQAPSQAAPTGQQTDLPIAIASTEPVTTGVKPIALPKEFKERVAAVRDLVRAEGGEWTIDRATSRFSGRNTTAKLEKIEKALEALEGAGLLLSYKDNGEQRWYDASLQAIA
ncbi:class I SAM-dependent DNA methyltransferase [Limnothrix sp. FACHB-1083]|nr:MULTISPECIES: class I SAM-dependent DNA methyltransferase [unclassified Limnothrix]MBD2160834.1 class I SAM-dependent DNA methyltransferase [Limnothrix sp. FACHB-1083]MBD2191323.1 class I SAM-dependent DNA methyltransferase [Limnothrix sp. FACHB-1088]